MSFKSEHPNYGGYESDEFFVSHLPSNFDSALQGFIIRHSNSVHVLKAIINDIAGRIPTAPTTNWGWDFLVGDLSGFVGGLCRLPLPKVMDFLAEACLGERPFFAADAVNELLDDLKVGYELEIFELSDRSSWQLRSNVSSRASAIEDTAAHVKDICDQAFDHLDQAKVHLVNTKSDRDRKDAIRDCLSAMEAMLKALTGQSDIKAATSNLLAANKWGPDTVVKDGLSLWDRLHDLYPDIRHGNPKKSEISDEEAIYWSDRITCFIRYISRMNKRI